MRPHGIHPPRRFTRVVLGVLVLAIGLWLALSALDLPQSGASPCYRSGLLLVWEYIGCHAGHYSYRRNRLTGQVQRWDGPRGWVPSPGGIGPVL